MKKTFFLYMAALCVLITLDAHPVSICWLNVQLDHDRMTVHYRLLAEDLVLYYNPIHDEYFQFQSRELITLAEAHQRLVVEHLEIASEGQVILPSAGRIIQNQLPMDGKVDGMDLMKYELIYAFDYRVDPDWKELTFHNYLYEEAANFPIVTYFSFTHDGQKLARDIALQQEPLRIRRGEAIHNIDPSEVTRSFVTMGLDGIYHELTLPAETLKSLVGFTDGSEINPMDVEVFLDNSLNRVRVNGQPLPVNCSQYIRLSDGPQSVVYLNLYYPIPPLVESLTFSWFDYTWQFRWFDSHVQVGDSAYFHRFSRFQPEIQIPVPALKGLETGKQE